MKTDMTQYKNIALNSKQLDDTRFDKDDKIILTCDACEEFIENTCEWLADNLLEFIDYDCLNGIDIDYGQLDKQFRKAMRDKYKYEITNYRN